MRICPHAVLILTLLGIACQPQEPAEPAGLSEAETEAIRSVSESFVQTVLAGNFDSTTALYTEDAVVMPPNAPSATGHSAIREWLGTFPPIEEFDLEIQEIEGRGDLAYVRGAYTMELMPPQAPGSVQDRGKYIEIRRRQEDGSWLITHDIFNSDQPSPGQGAPADTAMRGEGG